MASVRLTHELRREIARTAIHAFKVANPEPKPSTEFEQRLRDAVPRMPSQIALKKMLDTATDADIYSTEGFGCNTNKLSFNTIDKIILQKVPDVSEYDTQFKRNSLQIELSAPVNIVGYGDNYWGIKQHVDISAFALEDQTYISEQATTLYKKREDVKTAGDSYTSTIERLLAQCNTLKQLLEVWPAAENLIPQGYIVKMHEKVTRRQRAQQVKEDIDFNADEINQVVLTAKLMGA